MQLFLGADPDTVSATYRSVGGRGLEDNAVVTVGYRDQKIGVIEAGFTSPNPFTIEIFGTEGSLTYTDAGTVLRVAGPAFGGEARELPLPEPGKEPFAQWVDHITDGTRADDNLARAVELTRMVAAANQAAAKGRTIAYAPELSPANPKENTSMPQIKVGLIGGGGIASRPHPWLPRACREDRHHRRGRRRGTDGRRSRWRAGRSAVHGLSADA